jgi:hypothetical protein
VKNAETTTRQQQQQQKNKTKKSYRTKTIKNAQPAASSPIKCRHRQQQSAESIVIRGGIKFWPDINRRISRGICYTSTKKTLRFDQ